MSHPNAGYIVKSRTAITSPAIHLLKPCASHTLDQCVCALSAALFGTSFATMASFYRVHQAAGLLMLPYLFWACYASAAINYSLRGSKQTPNARLRKQAERPVAQAAPQSDAQSVIHSEAAKPPSAPQLCPPQSLQQDRLWHRYHAEHQYRVSRRHWQDRPLCRPSRRISKLQTVCRASACTGHTQHRSGTTTKHSRKAIRFI